MDFTQVIELLTLVIATIALGFDIGTRGRK